MKTLTKIFFTCAIVGSIYCAYRQGVINERKRWQSTGTLGLELNLGKPPSAPPVVPPSNIRAKVK